MTAATATPLDAVSVIAPVFDDRARVASLVDALRPLAERGARVIVVDDGSSDGTGQALADLVAGSEHFQLVRLPSNVGVAAARNHALELVDREFVWFCDSDDRWDPGILDVLLGAARAHAADVVVAGALVVHGDVGLELTIERMEETVVDGDVATDLLLSGTWHGYLWNKLFRTEHIAQLRFPAQRSQSDFTLTFDALHSASVAVGLPDVVYTHVVRPGSLSQAQSTHENLERCWLHVAQRLAAEDRPPRVDLDFFRLWFFVNASAASLWRSELSRVEQRAISRRLATGLRPRDVRIARRYSRTAALRVMLLLTTRGRAADVARLLRRVSALFRATPRPAPPSAQKVIR